MLAGYKIVTIVTLNYGGKIICVMANIIFSQFFNENCRQQHYFVDNIGRKLKVLIKYQAVGKVCVAKGKRSSSFCIFQVKNKVLC